MGDTEQQALDKLAQQAGAEGTAYDNALFQLVTGFKDEMKGQMAQIVELVKGGKAPAISEDEDTGDDDPAPETDEGEGEGEGGEETGDEGGEDPEGEPGFVDNLDKGNEGGDLEDYVDATDWVQHTGVEIQRLRKGLDAQKAVLDQQAEVIRTQQEQITQLLTLQQRQGVAIATLLGPIGELVKGVHARIIPETGEEPATAASTYDQAVQNSVRQAVREQLQSSPDSNGFTVQTLLKARREGVLSENALKNYKRLGVFSGDEAENAELTQKVRALEQD